MTETTDPLRDILRHIQISSAVFLRGEFRAPWGFTSCTAEDLAGVLELPPAQIVLFHVIREGACHITLDTGEAVQAQAGEALVLPYAGLHQMSWPPDAESSPIETLIPPPPWSDMPVVRHGGDGAPTRILCGYLLCAEMIFNPILNALPPLIHVGPRSAELTDLLRAASNFAIAAPVGSDRVIGPTVSRLTETLLIECLRQCSETLPAAQTGMLAALRDPLVARAIGALHACPARRWTVNDLAHEVGASRSVLAQRFNTVLRQSPMRYLTNWRLQLAANLLTHSASPVAQVAYQVGYQSEAAFSRAFKRTMDKSPSDWREEQA